MLYTPCSNCCEEIIIIIIIKVKTGKKAMEMENTLENRSGVLRQKKSLKRKREKSGENCRKPKPKSRG